MENSISFRDPRDFGMSPLKHRLSHLSIHQSRWNENRFFHQIHRLHETLDDVDNALVGELLIIVDDSSQTVPGNRKNSLDWDVLVEHFLHHSNDSFRQSEPRGELWMNGRPWRKEEKRSSRDGRAKKNKILGGKKSRWYSGKSRCDLLKSHRRVQNAVHEQVIRKREAKNCFLSVESRSSANLYT